MKVAITGSSGLAEIITNTLQASPYRGDVIKVNSIRIEDIIMNDTQCWIYDKDNENNVDVLINHAHNDFDQTKILDITHRAWQNDSTKFIINISSRAAQPNISKGYMYSAQKASLNHLANNLTYNSNRQYRSSTLNLGLLNSPELPSLKHQDVAGVIYYLITSFPDIEIPEITIQAFANYKEVQSDKEDLKELERFTK
jgi:hypothetical protein